MLRYLTIICILLPSSFCDYIPPNLPEEHLPYYFNSFPSEAEKCLNDSACNQLLSKKKHCWGYEDKCDISQRYSYPSCPGDHRGWVKTKKEQVKTFYSQADFGYVKEQRDELQLLCKPTFIDDSSLECSKYLRFCRGRNILIDFSSLKNRTEPIRYNMDVLKNGDIGGYCEYYKDKLENEIDHLSPLQSWAPELRYFTQLDNKVKEENCDIFIEKPTFILKIDATVNMYHHFCDFFNLYASLHVNSSHPSSFSTDVHILIWESYTYRSFFEETFKAFTDHPVWDLKTVTGSKVCFKNVVFPLLPRMIFGLYYNTPLIYGCEKSGLFNAFSKHILHRLKIALYKRKDKKLRITFLSRNTQYRNVLNEDELIDRLKENDEYSVQKVNFNRYFPFLKQLEVIRNSDIFIGIHGAGLTHLLFLPPWATVIELYNCEDPNCYFDLARLAGIKYITWKNKKKLQQFMDENYQGGAHAKFANYSFDIEEFSNLVKEAEIGRAHV